eukprot:COSAG04_NODE_25602_length_305_cov_1.004854_1_plen_39_part_10
MSINSLAAHLAQCHSNVEIGVAASWPFSSSTTGIPRGPQ